MSEPAQSAASRPAYEMASVGGVRHTPVRATGGGWGPYEVHPHRVQVVRDGRAELEHRGEWVIVPPPGEKLTYQGMVLDSLVCAAAAGRGAAERIAALANGDMPTRVVDTVDEESASVHTKASVEAELRGAFDRPAPREIISWADAGRT